MQYLALLILLLISQDVSARTISCPQVNRLVRNANESMSIMRNKGFTDYVKTRFRNVIDNGRSVDTGFLNRLQAGRSIRANRFAAGRVGNHSQNLQDHFEKHAREFSPRPSTANQYLRMANRFLANEASDTISLRSGRSGRTVKFNPRTRELATVDDQGRIYTYNRVSLDFVNRTSPGGPYTDLMDWFYYTKWGRHQ